MRLRLVTRPQSLGPVPSHAALALCLGFAFLERRKLPFFPTKLIERDQARALFFLLYYSQA